MNDISDPRQRVLIVDDATENIRILGQLLKPMCKVSFATNGRQALDRLENGEKCDLILLDIKMPEMDGYEVCRRIKAAAETCNIPVIFITSLNEEEDEARGLELGAVDYITKPFSQAIVKARVRTHLELKRHRDVLENLSSLDGLTGIPNRRRFDEYIEVQWRSAAREGTHLSVVMVDVDFFGAYNETYDHLAGDDTLRRLARTLMDTVRRPTDFVARYGGEEFIVVLPRTELSGAMHMAENMRTAIAEMKIPHAGSPVADVVTASLGAAAILASPDAGFTRLLRTSDSALFQAKREGRNQVRGIQL